MNDQQVENQLTALARVPRILDGSRQTLIRMRQNGKFGPEILRLTKKLVVRTAELQAWIAAGLPDRASWLQMRAAENRRLRVAGG
jgi:hypothetical protein